MLFKLYRTFDDLSLSGVTRRSRGVAERKYRIMYQVLARVRVNFVAGHGVMKLRKLLFFFTVLHILAPFTVWLSIKCYCLQFSLFLPNSTALF